MCSPSLGEVCFQNPCRKDFAIAADGTYTLVVGTNAGAGVRYTLRATAQ